MRRGCWHSHYQHFTDNKKSCLTRETHAFTVAKTLLLLHVEGPRSNCWSLCCLDTWLLIQSLSASSWQNKSCLSREIHPFTVWIPALSKGYWRGHYWHRVLSTTATRAVDKGNTCIYCWMPALSKGCWHGHYWHCVLSTSTRAVDKGSTCIYCWVPALIRGYWHGCCQRLVDNNNELFYKGQIHLLLNALTRGYSYIVITVLLTTTTTTRAVWQRKDIHLLLQACPGQWLVT